MIANRENSKEMGSSGEISDGDAGKDPPQGSEETRMHLLSDALHKTVDKCTSNPKFALFAKVHRNIYKKHREELKDIHKRFRETIRDNMKLEIETLFEEEGLASLLNELDTLVKESDPSASNPAWRPSGVPKQDVRAHLMAVRQRQRSMLHALLEKEQATTKHLESLSMLCKNRLQQLQNKSQDLMAFFQQGCDEGNDCLEHIKNSTSQ